MSTSAPTVTTQAVTLPTGSTCVGNGNITSTGGVNPTVRGFCYMVGTSGDPTTANSVKNESGSFGVGAYALTITGLAASTSYRVRAYATNSKGTGYGTTVQTATGAVTNIAATKASITLAVYAAAIKKDTGVSATKAALTLATFPATVQLSTPVNIQATFAPLTLTAYTATTNATKNISVSKANTTLSTYVVGVNATQNISTSKADILLQTYLTEINKSLNISVSGVALTLVAYQSVVSQSTGTTVNASVAEMMLSTYSTQVSASINIQASCYEISVATYQAEVTLKQNTVIDVSVHELLLATYQSTISHNSDIQTNVSNLTLITYPVSFEKEVTEEIKGVGGKPRKRRVIIERPIEEIPVATIRLTPKVDVTKYEMVDIPKVISEGWKPKEKYQKPLTEKDKGSLSKLLPKHEKTEFDFAALERELSAAITKRKREQIAEQNELLLMLAMAED